MSFLLILDVDGLTEDQGRTIEARCRQPGMWPVRFRPSHRRRFAVFGPREAGPTISMPDTDNGRHLLSADAVWDAPAWAMEPDLLPRLAQTVAVLGEELPQGFSLRATWSGSEVRHERLVATNDLASLVLASQLNEFTLYRVPPRDMTDADGSIADQA